MSKTEDSLALFSECKSYRYLLSRNIGIGPTVSILMANPSIADGENDDPTIRRCMSLAKNQGWGKILIINKFAYISSDISVLSAVRDPVGEYNDQYITEALEASDKCVFAWGTLAKFKTATLKERWKDIHKIARNLNIAPLCWGANKDGHPKHPLFISGQSPVVPWLPPVNG